MTTLATTTAPAATSSDTPADRFAAFARELGPDFAPAVIRSESDEHGEPCGWCEDNHPIVTNVYFAENHGGVVYDEMAHTCYSAACVLSATSSRTDAVVEVEVSIAPAIPVQVAPASW